jgi:TolA-binding protein
MDTQEPKVKINARIDADLHRWIQTEDMTVSQAVNDGITLLRESRSIERDTKADNYTQACDTKADNYTQACDTKAYTSSQEHTKTVEGNVSQELRERITDLRGHIELVSDQLSRKDEQISQLNEVTQKQAVHIQSLIQENSKQNMKLLPEVDESKPWWKFW